MRNLFLVILLSLFTDVVCQGQVSEQWAKAKADTAARSGLNYSESHLLRAHRREDLEDDLFRVQVKLRGKIAKAAYFYEISGDGSFVLSPDEALYVDSADGHLIHLVAVSTRTGEAYLLFGFKNADLEFNRLATDASLRIESPIDAWMSARLYFTVVANPSGERLIYGSLPLKHKIEDYFFSVYPEKEAERLSKKWWSGFDADKWKAFFGSLSSKNSLGFETTFAALNSSPKKIPVLDLWTLQISTDGRCQTKSIRAVYPAKAGV